MKTEWKASDAYQALNTHEIEFQDNAGEFHHFFVLELADRYLFGGACNVGFLESGYILKDESESKDKTLSELLADLEVYYNDGKQYVSRIVCNERM